MILVISSDKQKVNVIKIMTFLGLLKFRIKKVSHKT